MDYDKIDEVMLQVSAETNKICTLKGADTKEEMYDRCQEIMNYSGTLSMEQVKVSIILQKLENNHANILLSKEIPTNNTLVKDLRDGKEGIDFSSVNDKSLSAKTPQRKKLLRDADKDIHRSLETIANVKATLEFIKNRVEYCKYIWSAYDRAVASGFLK